MSELTREEIGRSLNRAAEILQAEDHDLDAFFLWELVRDVLPSLSEDAERWRAVRDGWSDAHDLGITRGKDKDGWIFWISVKQKPITSGYRTFGEALTALADELRKQNGGGKFSP